MAIPQDDLESLDPEDRAILQEAEIEPNAITTSTVVRQKLGLFSTCSMILNRVIGTGIFSTPANILKETGSPGASLLLWGLGAIISFAGLMVYMEFGLSIPRYKTQEGEDIAVPRSGGEKNYLEYVYRTPRYLTTCVFGIAFIVLGNTAGNAISFGEHLLLAGGYPDKDVENESFQWRVKGIAVIAITLACLLHGSWRAGGIWINNFFATIKCLLLLVFIIAGIVFSAGKGRAKPTHNLDNKCAFVWNGKNSIPDNPCPGSTGNVYDPLGEIYGYSQSLLLIIFAYSGFENANYILSEIHRPRRTYKLASILSFGLISLLYMLTNIVYFLVVPRERFNEEGTQLAVKYFELINGSGKVKTAVASFVAFSSLGNIIVVTFVASRVKQEIAKEGVIPFSRIIASDMQSTFSFFRNAFFGPARKENVPIAALFVHWVFSFILVLSPKTSDAFTFLLLLHSYGLHVVVGFFLALGLLYLYFKPGLDWNEMREFRPFGDWIWALFYAVTNAFLICVAWVPPPSVFKNLALKHIAYFVYPTVAVSLIALGVIYWIGFAHIYPRYSKRTLSVRRYPIVQGGVQVYEAVFFNWVVPDDHDSEVGSQVLEANDGHAHQIIKA